ncbi:MAG: L-lactate dehydrogenase, partial [Anaerotignum sp.]|nr:L-lactate dehydrogenase [Anaerotignum sp.]
MLSASGVGATVAFSLMHSSLFSEILLIDINRRRAVGEAMDLSHALPFLAPA